MLCRVAKIQVGSRSGNFRQNRVGSIRVESVNVNRKMLNFLLQAFLCADKSAEWMKSRLKTSHLAVNHCLENKMTLFFWPNLWLWSLLISCLPLVYIRRQYLTRNRPYPRAYYPTYSTLEINPSLIKLTCGTHEILFYRAAFLSFWRSWWVGWRV